MKFREQPKEYIAYIKSVENEFYSKKTEKWGMNLEMATRDDNFKSEELWVTARCRYAILKNLKTAKQNKMKVFCYVAHSGYSFYIKYMYLDIDFEIDEKKLADSEVDVFDELKD